MRRLIPLSDEIKHQRHDKHQRERGQKARQPESQGRRADTEQHRPQHEQGQILRRVITQLRERLADMTPFRWSHRHPLEAAAAGQQQNSHRDQSETDPDRPPVFLAEQLRSGFTSQGLGSIFYEFCHGRSRFLSGARKEGLSFSAPRRTLL